MFLINKDYDGTRNGIGVGRVVGRFTTYRNEKGFLVSEFSVCVKSNFKEKKYTTLRVCAYGEYPQKVLKYAKLNREAVVVIGNCTIDKTMTDLKGDTHYSMYALAVICPRMIADTYEWYQNSKNMEKILSENYEQNIQYDYTEEPKAEDHMI